MSRRRALRARISRSRWVPRRSRSWPIGPGPRRPRAGGSCSAPTGCCSRSPSGSEAALAAEPSALALHPREDLGTHQYPQTKSRTRTPARTARTRTGRRVEGPLRPPLRRRGRHLPGRKGLRPAPMPVPGPARSPGANHPGRHCRQPHPTRRLALRHTPRTDSLLTPRSPRIRPMGSGQIRWQSPTRPRSSACISPSCPSTRPATPASAGRTSGRAPSTSSRSPSTADSTPTSTSLHE